jgi:hypothetical protein
MEKDYLQQAKRTLVIPKAMPSLNKGSVGILFQKETL